MFKQERAIILYSEYGNGLPIHVYGVIKVVADHYHTMYDTPKAIEQHLCREPWNATDVVCDGTIRIVSFTTGGAAPYRTSFKWQYVNEECITEYKEHDGRI